VYIDLPFFICNFITLSLFPPHFSQISQGFENLIYLFKETAFCFIDSLWFLACISLILALFFIFSLLLELDLACTYFSRTLWFSIRSHIWNICVFLIYSFMAINLTVFVAFAVCKWFLLVVLSFSLNFRNFSIHPLFLWIPSDYGAMCCSVSYCFFSAVFLVAEF
jgi:hypothetical protein